MRRIAMAVVLLCSPLLAGCGGGGGTKASAAGAGKHLTNVDWGAVEANPDAYAGATVAVVGKVFRVSTPKDGPRTIHIWADPQLDAQATVVSAPVGRHFGVGQYLQVHGVVASDQSGTPGAAPLVDARAIRVVSGLAARSPTLRSTFGNRFTLHGVTFHPYRIEFAKDETRVFVRLANHTKHAIQLNNPNTYFVQHHQTYHPAESTLDYPQLPATIAPGGKAFGVIVFPAMSPKTRGMRLYLDVDAVNVKGGNVSVIWSWKT